MKFICSLITVEDIKLSRNFYENILNQKVKYDFGENVTFEGDFSIHQQKHFSQLIDNKIIHRESNNFELYFEYNNIEEIEQKLINYNVEFIHKKREQPWRQRVIRFYDPDRHIIEVGESMEFLAFRLSKENKSTEEIASTISMSVDFVKSAIQKHEIDLYSGRVPSCGCFCGGCPNYTRKRNRCPGADKNTARCEKCKTFHLCCQDKGITYCYQCNEFPCKSFKSFAKRWEKYGQNFIENQCLLKSKGTKDFLTFYNNKALLNKKLF